MKEFGVPAWIEHVLELLWMQPDRDRVYLRIDTRDGSMDFIASDITVLPMQQMFQIRAWSPSMLSFIPFDAVVKLHVIPMSGKVVVPE